MDLKIGNSKPFTAVIALIVLTVGVVLMGCTGPSDAETGRTFDASTFSESNARETLAVAVRDHCLNENLGVSRLASPLRRVEIAAATKQSADWNFRSDGKVVTVSAAGQVSGDLLKDLTSQC